MAPRSEKEGARAFRVGWGSADITPTKPVLLAGQFHARVSEGVADPIGATAMAIECVDAEGSRQASVLVSCDLVCIADGLRDAVRDRLRTRLPDLDPMRVVLNATHTHTAPEVPRGSGLGGVPARPDIDLGVMPAQAYADFAADRISDAIVQAWEALEPAGIGFGLAHATIGYNRRICTYAGETRMYGGVADPQFSHTEGGADSSINVLCVWNAAEKLTGVVVNLACPSQVSEQGFEVSADYWHETRAALRDRLGEDLFILPQVSAAGDVVPAKSKRTVPDWRALERMWEQQGLTQRQDIAQRITQAVAPVVEGVGRRIDWRPVVIHRVERVALSVRWLSEADLAEAMDEAARAEQKYEALSRELEANPGARDEPRWYVNLTMAYRRMQWNRQVAQRYEQQQREATLPVEMHVLRLGDVAMATNRFELYLDFGLQIKARSRAVQTFVVQLAGPGTYLPTQRAVAGRSYGATAPSTPVGPAGGRELVQWTVEAINGMYDA